METGHGSALVSDFSADELSRMKEAAWAARERARTYSGIKVGAAILSEQGEVFAGCNVEHRFRAHDLHAEVNAIGSLVAGSGAKARAVMVVSEESLFTPCGGCMDWIFEQGGPDCTVLVMNSRDSGYLAWHAAELMPHYPHQ
jgi:cytidine deaminase